MFPDLVSWRTTQYPRGGKAQSPADDHGLEVHHTGDANVATNADQLRDVCRRVWKFHVETKGWADIFYGFLVAEDGSTAEGRGFDRGTSSDHRWLTVCLVGNTDQRKATAAQVEAVRRIRSHHLHRGGGDQLRGHGDRDSTACPGAGGRWVLEQLRAGAKPAGPPAPAPVDLSGLAKGFDLADARWPWMARGARGKTVELAQHALNVSSGAGLLVDGIYGAKTEAAVRNVQAFFGLKFDPPGVIGPGTAPVILTDWTLPR